MSEGVAFDDEVMAEMRAKIAEKSQRDPKTGCVVWQGRARHPFGYGLVSIGPRNDNHVFTTSRLSYLAHFGFIPHGMVVRHRCDNPACVNPAHLELGTQAQNLKDMAERGRARNQNTGKRYCKRGHEFTPENTYQYAYGKHCKTCVKLRAQQRRATHG